MGEEKQTHIVQPPRVIQRQPTPEEMAMMKSSQERAVIEQKKARMIGVAATILSGILVGREVFDKLDRNGPDSIDDQSSMALDYAESIIRQTEERMKGN